MAENARDRDESYDQALQRTMHSTLPAILAKIADFRPTDPISYLAHCLYQTREQEKIQEADTTQCNEQPSPERVTEKHPSTHLITQHISSNRKQPVILNKSTDFNEVGVTDTKLHNETLTLFNQIGDLFDEADIS